MTAATKPVYLTLSAITLKLRTSKLRLRAHWSLFPKSTRCHCKRCATLSHPRQMRRPPQATPFQNFKYVGMILHSILLCINNILLYIVLHFASAVTLLI